MRLPGNQVRLRGQMAREQQVHCFLPHAAALLENAIVHPAFDFKEHRRPGMGAVIAQPEFETVLVAVDRAPIQFQIVGIQVEAVHRVGIIGPADAEFIHRQVAADEIAHEQGGRFGNQILQLEALRLHPVSGHRSKNRLLVWLWPSKQGRLYFLHERRECNSFRRRQWCPTAGKCQTTLRIPHPSFPPGKVSREVASLRKTVQPSYPRVQGPRRSLTSLNSDEFRQILQRAIAHTAPTVARPASGPKVATLAGGPRIPWFRATLRPINPVNSAKSECSEPKPTK